MKLYISITILFFLSLNIAFPQSKPAYYRVNFTDKYNSQYSINLPEEFLSERAIQRRVNQNISIKENDLPVNKNYIDSLKRLGFEIHNTSKWFNSVIVRSLNTELFDVLGTISFVKSYKKVKPKLSKKINNKTNKQINDNFYSYGASARQIEMLNGNILHNQGYRGNGLIIGVLDGGFYKANTLPAFESLWNNNQILGTKNFVDTSISVFTTASHGMSVLSIMGGNVSDSLVGTAPEAKYWLLQSEDVSTEYLVEEDNWVSAAEFADSAGADVLNTSLGYTTFQDDSQSHSYADLDGNTTRITKGADIAASKGMFLVVSAGNAGNSSWLHIGAPADADSVLAIGSVSSSETYSNFSSVGPSYDGRVKPNVTAQGSSTIVQSSSGAYINGNGTSFSGPVVCGLVACLWQANPEATNMEILKAIEESASQYNNPDEYLGYGIPDFGRANLLLQNIDYADFNKENVARFYPNPIVSDFNIEFYSIDSQQVTINIYNLLGSKIFTNKYDMNLNSYNKLKLNCFNNIKNGLYFVELISLNKKYSLKVLKQ